MSDDADSKYSRDGVLRRRSAVGALIGTVASIVLWPKLGRNSGRSGSNNTSSPPPRTLGGTNATAPEGYASPSYLPSGYRISRVSLGGKMGFGSPEEVLTLCGNPRIRRGYPYPLHVVVSKSPVRPFWGTEGATPEQITAGIGGILASATRVEYFDGMWTPDPQGPVIAPNGARLSWKRSNGHALVVTMPGFSIGVRGFRETGVTKEELLRVAGSLV